MYQSWINLRDRASSEYSNDVANFIEIATNQLDKDGKRRGE